VAAQWLYTVAVNIITPVWKMSVAGHVMWVEEKTMPDEERG
jgi:hypothetical protein